MNAILSISQIKKSLLFPVMAFVGNYLCAQPNFDLKEVFKFKEKTINDYTTFISIDNGFFFKADVPKKYSSSNLYFYSALTGKAKMISGFEIDGNYDEWITLNNKLIFTAVDKKNGNEIWVSDGTQKGTMMLKDCNAIGPNEGSMPSNYVEFQGKIFFTSTTPKSAGDKTESLWCTDGTANGTKKIKDIRSKSLWGKATMVVFKNKLYFSGIDPDAGEQLFVSDGTTEGTSMLKAIGEPVNKNAMPKKFIVVGDHMFFTANPKGYKGHLFVTDGTAEGTKDIKDVLPADEKTGLDFNQRIAFQNKLFFIQSQGYPPNQIYSLWCSDGTVEGTKLVTTADNGTAGVLNYPGGLFVQNDKLYVNETNQMNGSRLFEIHAETGVANSVSMIKNCPEETTTSVLPKYAFFNTSLYDYFLLLKESEKHTVDVYKSDGSFCGTTLLKSLDPGISSNNNFESRFFGNLGKYTFIMASSYYGSYPYTQDYKSWLWATDGTMEGTVMVSPQQPEKAKGRIYSNITDKTYFTYQGSYYFKGNFKGYNALYKVSVK